ncbi:YwqJ-related putative deaminase [Streptomyces sp. NPDC006711]|uniref:YwqJ-related putative deaminase n=1 Tax=Streptomyces sp. NPDC006711 TaxID=3364762 RepID=UPI0036992F0E
MTPGHPRLTPGDARLTPGDARLTPGDARVTPGDARLTPGDAHLTPGDAHLALGDPRLTWSATATTAAPLLRHRRDGILPAIAAALSVRGETLTCTAGKGEQPPVLHTLVQDYLDTLTSAQRERFTGRCPEAILLSRHLTAVESGRSKRAQRKPLTHGEARRALKHAKLTARRIREDGDPLHGSYAPPCRSCTALLAHFGVRSVEP